MIKIPAIQAGLPAIRHMIGEGTAAGQPVLDAVRFLRDAEGDTTMTRMRQAPLGVISRPWRRFVLGNKRSIDRHYYTFCTLERLQDALRPDGSENHLPSRGIRHIRQKTSI